MNDVGVCLLQLMGSLSKAMIIFYAFPYFHLLVQDMTYRRPKMNRKMVSALVSVLFNWGGCWEALEEDSYFEPVLRGKWSMINW